VVAREGLLLAMLGYLAGLWRGPGGSIALVRGPPQIYGPVEMNTNPSGGWLFSA